MRNSKGIIFFIFLLAFIAGLGVVYAAGINSTYKWAWNDVMGWIDFRGNPPNDINVVNDKLKNYGFFYSDSDSYIALDCQTTPNGDICASNNFFVSNTLQGNLAGWAWNDVVGWISFCGNASDGSTYSGSTWVCPTSPTYQVTIDDDGYFHGWAWNDVVGWISFNCNNSGIGNTCSTSDYKVKTTWDPSGGGTTSGWLESSTFDTGFPGGVVLNSIMWLGSSGSGGTNIVKFQVATANCSGGQTNPPQCTSQPGWGGGKTSGDGAYVGSDGTSATYYQPSGPVVPAMTPAMNHNNKRYFRYKVFIEKDGAASTPVVRDVLVNWSP